MARAMEEVSTSENHTNAPNVAFESKSQSSLSNDAPARKGTHHNVLPVVNAITFNVTSAFV